MVKAQEWLDREYPKKDRSEVKELDISNKELEGELDLGDFKNLEELSCINNKLTTLNLSSCLKLKRLRCGLNKLKQLDLIDLNQLEAISYGDNYLNSFDYSSLSPNKLTHLNISDNNLPEQDLTVFSRFTKLKELWIGGNNKEHLQQNIYNKFTGSLDHLSELKQLRRLDISNTDINQVDLTKLSSSLGIIEYSTKERPSCKLTEIVPQLEKHSEYGWCQKCQQPNISKNWCQSCFEKELKQDLGHLTGQELVEKFIKQQKENYKNLKWIPYEKFTDIEHLADGGFSKIYKAKWEREKEYWESDYIVLKFLNNSQSITLEFLIEIANTKLVDSGFGSNIVHCYGISQDSETKNYVMVIDYKKDGDLREYLKNNYNKLNWENKIWKLRNISYGLRDIHNQNLVHHDLHSGNILNNDYYPYITDLGLSKPVNHQKEVGKIYGVLPYVAPEVLRGNKYTQKADIYSFSIIAYEVLSSLPPYYDREHDSLLGLAVCQGLRPQFKIKIPALLEELIDKCWNTDPIKRPSAKELRETLNNWWSEIRDNKNTEFTQQLQEAEEYNQSLPKNIRFPKYEIHPRNTYTSKMIDTNEITKRLNELGLSEKLNIQKSKETFLKESEEIAPIEILSQPTDWTNIRSSFADELIQQWQSLNFTHQQTQDWINTSLQPTDYNFCAWLRDNKHFTPEQVLNKSNLEQLNQEFLNWREQQQTNIEIPPK